MTCNNTLNQTQPKQTWPRLRASRPKKSWRNDGRLGRHQIRQSPLKRRRQYDTAQQPSTIMITGPYHSPSETKSINALQQLHWTKTAIRRGRSHQCNRNEHITSTSTRQPCNLYRYSHNDKPGIQRNPGIQHLRQMGF